MLTIHAQRIVRLHTDATGVVWLGADAPAAINTQLKPDAFMANTAFACYLEDADGIRLFGTRANAPLIVCLQEKRSSNSLFNAKIIEIGSPAIIAPEWRANDDCKSILQQLRQPPLSACVFGNWHAMTNADYATYALLDAYVVGSPLSSLAKRLLVQHPAWPVLRFIVGVDQELACRLLCDIVDPRWFRHPTRPSRLTRLYSYLGISPQNMNAYQNMGQPGQHYDRAVNVLKLWYRSPHQPDGVPGEFLMRELFKYKDDLAKGLLRCSQRFLQLLCGVWLHACEKILIDVYKPAQFFADQQDAVAFIKQWKQR